MILGYEIEHFKGSSGGGGHSSDNIKVDATPQQNTLSQDSSIANISSTGWDGRRPQSGGMNLPRVPPKQYSDDWDTPNDDGNRKRSWWNNNNYNSNYIYGGGGNWANGGWANGGWANGGWGNGWGYPPIIYNYTQSYDDEPQIVEKPVPVPVPMRRKGKDNNNMMVILMVMVGILILLVLMMGFRKKFF